MSPDDQALRARLGELAEQYGDHPLVAELRGLTERHLRLVRQTAKITRISDRLQIELKTANQALALASQTDPLTGLPNRRYMVERLRVELSRVTRGTRPFALIMADIDHFKPINDQRGHDAGDMVLIETGRTLRAGLRGHDAIARWGGEEFLILLPDADAGTALTVAEKLRERVAAQAVALPNGPAITVTVSLGVAVLDPTAPLDACLLAADRALYAAKAAGRDRCVLAGR